MGASVAVTAAGVVLVGAGVRHIHHAPAPISATMAAPPIAIGNSGGPSPDEWPPNLVVGVRSSGRSSGSNSIWTYVKGKHEEHEIVSFVLQLSRVR